MFEDLVNIFFYQYWKIEALTNLMVRLGSYTPLYILRFVCEYFRLTMPISVSIYFLDMDFVSDLSSSITSYEVSIFMRTSRRYDS